MKPQNGSAKKRQFGRAYIAGSFPKRFGREMRKGSAEKKWFNVTFIAGTFFEKVRYGTTKGFYRESGSAENLLQKIFLKGSIQNYEKVL